MAQNMRQPNIYNLAQRDAAYLYWAIAALEAFHHGFSVRTVIATGINISIGAAIHPEIRKRWIKEDKEFFNNCGREILSSKTAYAAIGTAICLGTASALGVIDTATAGALGIGYIGGHITARAQARGDADRPVTRSVEEAQALHNS
jgi:hypothetical protein